MLLERVLAFDAVLLCDLGLALSLSGLPYSKGVPYSWAVGALVDPEGSRGMCVFHSLPFELFC